MAWRRKPQFVETDAEVTAFTTIFLGCGECPANRSLRIPSITAKGQHVPILNIPKVPFLLASEIEIEGMGPGQSFKASPGGIGCIGFNMNETCQNVTTECPNADAIEAVASALERLPGVIDSVVEPPLPLYFERKNRGTK